MTEEEKSESTEEEAAPEAAEAPEPEAPAEEPAAEAEPAAEKAPPAEEPSEPEPEAEEEEAPAAEQLEADPAAPGREAEEAAGVDSLTPKQIRKRERSIHRGEALPQRSPEERAAERVDRRGKKATVRRARRAAERAKRTPGTGTPRAERVPGTKMVRQGTVISDKADKTITVRLEIVRRHPKYEKIVRRSAKVRAHDENNDAHTGDVVRLIEARPTSRTKRWRLLEVLERAR
jgi:small subunit ribosomal protein S17